MKTNSYILIVALINLVILSGCLKHFPCINGNGDVVEVIRDEPPEFNQIESSGSFEIEVIEDADRFVQIKAESNLINLIETKVSKGRLHIGFTPRSCINNNRPILIEVHTPEVNYLGLSGSGSIVAHDIETHSLDINLSGSGNIDVSTNAREIYSVISGSGNIIINTDTDYIEGLISGSGNIIAEGSAKSSKWTIIGSGNIASNILQQQESECVINGSGNILVWATEKLKILINGSGNVIYTGKPDLSVTINGSGKVIKG